MSEEENFKKDILNALKYCKEKIDNVEFVVTENHCDDKRNFPLALLNKRLKLKAYLKYFDFEYDDGYGGRDCPTIYIYTEKRIFYIHEYDGSTNITYLFRNPEDLVEHKK